MSRFLILLLIPLAGCATQGSPFYSARSSPGENFPAPKTQSPRFSGDTVRVAIAVRKPSLRLEDPASFLISGNTAVGPGESPDAGERLQNLVLTFEKIQGGKMTAIPSGDSEILVEGKPYRGKIEIFPEKGGTLTAVNVVGLEDYVMGVVVREISSQVPLEALKAQAIASRTFAVYRKRVSAEQDSHYDLDNTSFSQNYKGSRGIGESVKKAVLETKGEIMTYRGTPILAPFHANCGGRTCGAGNVWGENKPYLRSVDCEFGNSGAHWQWKAEISEKDLTEKLREAGFNNGLIQDIKPLERDESGRVSEISLQTTDDRFSAHLKTSKFRLAVGPDWIKSTRFEVRREGEHFLFTGKGWGHGVGLCQEGACGMASRGYRAFEILRHYYNGIILEDLKAL